MKHIFLINRFSLKHRTDKMVNTIKKVCKRRKLDFEIDINNGSFSTEDIINKYKNTKHIIYAIGGDGTLNRVMHAIRKTKNIFSYIPYGSGNDFNRSAKELLHEGINDIDLIKINDMYCMNVTCFGIDADIANAGIDSASKWIPRSQKYNAIIVSKFATFKPKEFKITSHHETIEGKFTTILVCNGRYYGAGYHPNPEGSLDDHIMDIYLIEAMNKATLIKYIIKMKKGKLDNSVKARHIRTDKLTVESKNEVTANVDGEKLPGNKFELKIVKNGLSIYYDPELINEILNEMKKK